MFCPPGICALQTTADDTVWARGTTSVMNRGPMTMSITTMLLVPVHLEVVHPLCLCVDVWRIRSPVHQHTCTKLISVIISACSGIQLVVLLS